MLEMLKARKEQLEAQGKKGFTLMEMLIVIAIIAVLIAIVIPVFTSQLADANKAVDEANIRSGYAAAQSTVMMNAGGTETKYYLKADGSLVTDKSTADYLTKGSSGGSPVPIGGIDVAWSNDQKIEYTVGTEGGTRHVTEIKGVSKD